MDRKIDAGSLLVAGAALLLVVALFLDWFGDGGVALTAWEAFEVIDLLLLAAAGAAMAASFGGLDSRVLLGAAAIAVVLVASQLIQPPPAGQGADREIGAWLGLVGALGLLAGAALAAAKIAVTVDVRGRERRHRVTAVDKRMGPETATGDGGAGRSTQVDVSDRFAPDPGATQGFPATPHEPS